MNKYKLALAELRERAQCHAETYYTGSLDLERREDELDEYKQTLMELITLAIEKGLIDE